jgi:hypothetical protein
MKNSMPLHSLPDWTDIYSFHPGATSQLKNGFINDKKTFYQAVGNFNSH